MKVFFVDFDAHYKKEYFSRIVCHFDSIQPTSIVSRESEFPDSHESVGRIDVLLGFA